MYSELLLPKLQTLTSERIPEWRDSTGPDAVQFQQPLFRPGSQLLQGLDIFAFQSPACGGTDFY